MALWMADAAIRAALRAISEKTKSNPKRSCGQLYEVETALAVLLAMFEVDAADIRGALIEIPPDMDGIRSFEDRTYFGEFVAALRQRSDVMIRRASWITDLC